MKGYFVPIVSAFAVMISVVLIGQRVQAQDAGSQSADKNGAMIAGDVHMKTNSQASSAIFVTDIPPGYRDWKLISVAREEGQFNDIRAILGNDIAIKTYREGTLSFPDGAIIARIAWNYVPSDENNKIFGRAQSFVPGSPPEWYLQFMVKDSKKYAASGGWGYGQFDKDDKPAAPARMTSCFPCHQHVGSRDFVFTRYAP